MPARRILLALAAGLALADASIVTLALPDILLELDTSVEGVAAVIGVYTVVLAAALVPFEVAARGTGLRRLGVVGLVVFAVASLACAGADDLTGLLIARAVQALGGAAGLVAAFGLLGGGATSGRRLWVGAAVFATAVGPALGGALTQLFEWQAIFVFQAPVALAAALACALGPAAEVHGAPEVPERFALRPALGLALVSAALSAVLFLLVLLLVAGWSVSPLRAAVAVTVIPVAALAGTRVPGDARVRAATGSVLVGGGVLALAWLPDAGLWWTVVPQALAGVGMGLALTALGGELLPERTPRDAARLLAVRHAGIAVALAVLAPIAAAQLESSTDRARERGVALVLDARLPPEEKLRLAPALLEGVDTDDPRDGLARAVSRERGRFRGAELRTYDRVGERADETIVTAVGEAFRTAFLVTGTLALIAAVVLAPWGPPTRRLALVAAAAVLALAAPVAYAAAHASLAPEPVRIQDPCDADRRLPGTGGVTGFLQDRALELLDSTACRLGATREELVLALASEADARRFEAEHGVNPRSIGGLLGALLGGG